MGTPPLRFVRRTGFVTFSVAAFVLFACGQTAPLDAPENSPAVVEEADARPGAPDGGSLEAAAVSAEGAAPAACTVAGEAERSFATAEELESALLGLWRRCDLAATLCPLGDAYVVIRPTENSPVRKLTCGNLSPHGDLLIADRDGSFYCNVEAAPTPGAPFLLHVWNDVVDTRFKVSIFGDAMASRDTTVRVSSSDAVLAMQRTAFTTF